MGLVKRTPLSAYKNIRQGGLIACGVADGDDVAVVKLMNPDEEVDIFIMTLLGQCIRIRKAGPKGAPVFGRTARGNKGVRLRKGDHVVDALLIPAAPVEDEEDEVGVEDASVDEDMLDEEGEGEDTGEDTLLTVTSGGFGKRTAFRRYRIQGRAGLGVISHRTGEDVGDIVGALVVSSVDQVMLVTDTGRVIRIAADSVSLLKSRSSKGVKLMRLDDGERIVDIARLEETDEEEMGEGEGEEGVEGDSGLDDAESMATEDAPASDEE